MNYPYILSVESSCDDTAVAVLRGTRVLSNVRSSQLIHAQYGGVVPELASRAHQQNVIITAEKALDEAGIEKGNLDAVGATFGPGLLGSLMVGVHFAKGLSISLGIPLVEVNHLHGHVLSHYIDGEGKPPFPYLCLLISGGHTQIVWVKAYDDMEIIGSTLDDAVGEAFDKAAKTLGLPYPGGVEIDKHAREGDSHKFSFTRPNVDGLNMSFSGFKTQVLYFVQKQTALDPHFVSTNINDLCASIQYTLVGILIDKLKRAIELTGARHVALGGGVAANSAIRAAFEKLPDTHAVNAHLPSMAYTTDNAAMIGIVAYYKYMKQDFAPLNSLPKARWAV